MSTSTSMLNVAFCALWLLYTLYIVVAKGGVAPAFAFCYLPAIMLLRPIRGYLPTNGLPEFSAANASVMAMTIGMFLSFGKKLNIRWGLVDVIVLLAPIMTVISGSITENGFHTGYNEFVKQYCGWLVPYFVARVAFKSDLFRQQFLWVMVICIAILVPFVLVELRLWPHFYAKSLMTFGLTISTDLRAETRMGLFRTTASFAHPIFFGDGCVSMIGILLLLGYTTYTGLKNVWVQMAIGGALLGLFASLSFGPWAGAMVAAAIAFILCKVKFSRWMLGPAIALVIYVMAVYTVHLATTPLPERPRVGIADSFWVRRLIVQNSYRLVQTSGWFGYGRDLQDQKLDLDSVDNAYMLFAMCRGWIYAGMWVAIPLCLGLRVSKSMRRLKHSQVHIFPLAVGAGTVIGVSFAYYFVWAGWSGEPYTMLWLMLMAFTMSACDFCYEPAALPAGRGFEVVQPAGNGASYAMARPAM